MSLRVRYLLLWLLQGESGTSLSRKHVAIIARVRADSWQCRADACLPHLQLWHDHAETSFTYTTDSHADADNAIDST